MAFKDRKDSRNKRNGKCTERSSSSPTKSPIIYDENAQCYCPIVGCVCKGVPVPKSIDDGGIKMRCTNEKCQFVAQLVHAECFLALENHLIKVLSNIGSARGWTDGQLEHNLWGKKGLSIVQKHIRCKCDKGQMTRDTDFYKEILLKKNKKVIKKVEEHQPPLAAKSNAVNGNSSRTNNNNNNNSSGGCCAKQQRQSHQPGGQHLQQQLLKKKKKKELPRLNFGYNHALAPPSDHSDMYKKKFNELESHYLSSHNKYDDDYYDEDDVNSPPNSSDGGTMTTTTTMMDSSLNGNGGGTMTTTAMTITPITTTAADELFIDMLTTTIAAEKSVDSSFNGSVFGGTTTTPTTMTNTLVTTAEKGVYTLFGASSPNFLLGEQIIADYYLPRSLFS